MDLTVVPVDGRIEHMSLVETIGRYARLWTLMTFMYPETQMH